jgi:hypothetical protein
VEELELPLEFVPDEVVDVEFVVELVVEFVLPLPLDAPEVSVGLLVEPELDVLLVELPPKMLLIP